jgi:tRNA-splicing ligase RtcB
MRDLVEVLYNEVPSGVGSKGKVRLGPQDEKQLLRKGAVWAVENGFGDA